jgi:hypothetical protein
LQLGVSIRPQLLPDVKAGENAFPFRESSNRRMMSVIACGC